MRDTKSIVDDGTHGINGITSQPQGRTLGVQMRAAVNRELRQKHRRSAPSEPMPNGTAKWPVSMETGQLDKQAPNATRGHFHFAPERAFTIFGFVVAALLIIFFGADLVTAWPFARASIVMDVTFVICGAGLAYLSLDVYRDLS